MHISLRFIRTSQAGRWVSKHKWRIIMSEPTLPAITSSTLPALNEITKALGDPRTELASDEEIQYAWRDIPRELSRIPPELRSELLARMCVAVATGLFDGAINYAWNASIVQLRNRVRAFGLNVVSQILSKPFDEAILSELKDAELLSLILGIRKWLLKCTK